MRHSFAAVAVIRRGKAANTRYLAQWNRRWKVYNFISGHKQMSESFRQCMIREIVEELNLTHGADFRVGEEPLRHLEFDAWSRSANTQTFYSMELFKVSFLRETTFKRIDSNSKNRWLQKQEILNEKCEDGASVSATMKRLLYMVRVG